LKKELVRKNQKVLIVPSGFGMDTRKPFPKSKKLWKRMLSPEFKSQKQITEPYESLLSLSAKRQTQKHYTTHSTRQPDFTWFASVCFGLSSEASLHLSETDAGKSFPKSKKP